MNISRRQVFFGLLIVLAVSMRALPATSQWQIATPRETHDIPGSTGQFIDFSTVNLPAGMRYQIRTSGTIRTQFPKNNEFADGHYYVGIIPLPSGTVKVGLQVKYTATAFDFLQALAGALLNGSHAYTDLLTSQGTPLSFRFFDTEEPPGSKPYYGDNNGSMTVDVAQETPLLVVKDNAIDFGDVDFCSPKSLLDSIEVYGTGDFSVDRIAITGSSDFTVTSGHNVNGYKLSEPNADSTDRITVTFHPTKLGAQSAILHIYSSGAYLPTDRDRQITLTGVGHGAVLKSVVDTVHFGNVKVGATKTMNVAVQNTGDRAAQLTTLNFDITPIFASSDLKLLAPGNSTNVLVDFTPPAVQHYVGIGTLALDNGCSTAQVIVDGFGAIGTPLLLPDTLDFGQLVLGDSRTLSGKIKNVGGVGLDISTTALANSVDFASTGQNGPYTLDTNQFADYSITFTPQVHTPGGVHLGYLTFTFPNGQPAKQIVLIGRDHPPISGLVKIARNYFAYPDSLVTITQQLLTSFDSALAPVVDFTETITYNPLVLQLVRIDPGTLLKQPDWLVNAPTLVRGQVIVQATSSGASIHGPGELLKMIFKVTHDAKPLDSSLFIQSPISFGAGFEPLVTSSTGLLRVRDECTPTFVEGKIATSIEQNNPNPFNPTTSIVFYVGVGESTPVRINLYNSLGQLIRTLVDEDLAPGRHEVVVDGTALPSGVYTYTFDADGRHTTRRMVLSR